MPREYDDEMAVRDERTPLHERVARLEKELAHMSELLGRTEARLVELAERAYKELGYPI